MISFWDERLIFFDFWSFEKNCLLADWKLKWSNRSEIRSKECYHERAPCNRKRANQQCQCSNCPFVNFASSTNTLTSCKLNSPVTKNFPFSYFAFTFIHCSQVIKDIKNINSFHKSRSHGRDFGRESFYRNHHMTPW